MVRPTVQSKTKDLRRSPFTDIIFFIYLYQRYKYPVDRTRVNEFGTTGETPPAVVPINDEQLIESSQNSSSPIEQVTSDTTHDRHEKTE